MRTFLFLSIILLALACQKSPAPKLLPDLPDGVTEFNGNDWDRIMLDGDYVLNANP